MCWQIRKEEFDKNPDKYHKVAKEDIVVYKFGVQNSNIFLSIYQTNFWYEPNKSNKLIKLEWLEFNQVIREGYHSYSGECFYQTSPYRRDEYTLLNVYSKGENIHLDWCIGEELNNVGKFIIPKGTEYYENEEGEIVSSNLIWTGKSISFNNLETIGRCKIFMFKDINMPNDKDI